MGFELYLFGTDPATARRAVAAGVAGLVVDWETRGKAERQRGAGLEENRDGPDDIRRLKESLAAPVLCRVNPPGPGLAAEVEAAVQAGADRVLLPMVRSVREVECFLDLLAGRAGGGILVETRQAVEEAHRLARLPLALAYLGLNDLALERGTDLFEALADGTVERVRRAFRDVPFGFGGLTVMDRGFPIPSRLLALEMGRLGCDFTFLRRSFKADILGRDLREEVGRILDHATRPALPESHGELLKAIGHSRVRLR